MDNFKKLAVKTKHNMEIKYETFYYLCGITMAQEKIERKKRKLHSRFFIGNIENTLN